MKTQRASGFVIRINYSYNLLGELVIIKVNCPGEGKSCPVSFSCSSVLSIETCKVDWKFRNNHLLMLESYESAMVCIKNLSLP